MFVVRGVFVLLLLLLLLLLVLVEEDDVSKIGLEVLFNEEVVDALTLEATLELPLVFNVVPLEAEIPFVFV